MHLLIQNSKFFKYDQAAGKNMHWGIPENIHPPMDDTELGTQRFQDFQEGQ